MSWAESEKLNEWILRAYENGRREEQERIVKLLEESFYPLDYGRWQADELLEEIFRLIKGEPSECECDPCGNENCNCQGKRCDFCKAQDV